MKQFSRANFLFILSGNAVSTVPTGADTVKPVSGAMKTRDGGIAKYTGEWGQAQVLHLLRRSLFGVSYEDYSYFAKLTLSECLDILLTQSPKHSPPVNAYDTAAFTDPDVPFGQTWINSKPDPAILDDKRTQNLKAWWVGLMLNQDRSLTEKMTLFWSNNLATQVHTVVDSRYDYKYIALLRSQALGNFKHLVRDVTTDNAMLIHLNGDLNTASAANENYGRELQELFTVGKGPDSHYTEGDVEAAARVLTGWTDGPTAAPSLVFDHTKHDSSDKKFSAFYNNTVIKGRSGADGAKETDDLINMIFEQKETAKNFCRKLYRWFVYGNIDNQIESNVISPMADILISHHYEVKPVLRALLESEHFFNPLNMGCQIKNPADLLIGVCRQFQAMLPPAHDISARYGAWSALANSLKLMGMDLDEPPNVAGWPAYYLEPAYYEKWLNSNTISVRNSLTDQLASHQGMMAGTDVIKFDLLAFTAQLSDPADPERVMSDSLTLLSPNEFDRQEKILLKSILLPGGLADSNWTALWNSYSADPSDLSHKSAILNRLTPYYTYILQRAEYQLI